MRKFELVDEKFRKGKNNYENFKLPQRGTDFSAGYDFFNNMDRNIIVGPGAKYTYWTDIKYVTSEWDDVLLVFPRSSAGIKFDIVLANTVGIIDADYAGNVSNDGNIGICIKNEGNKEFIVVSGSAITQGIIMKYYIVDNDVPASKVRIGGIGSTDAK